MAKDSDLTQTLHQLRDTPELLATVQSSTGGELAIQKSLRNKYPAELVRAAITLHDLRQRATAKFARAAELWFDRKGIEQATAEAVAHHKARRFTGPVVDLCCGIGSDAIAMAHTGCEVIAIDSDPATLLCAQWNAEACGVSKQIDFRQADVTQLDLATLAQETPLLHIDPDRRAGRAHKAVRIEDYTPGLDYLRQLPAHFDGGAIKLSPACNFGGKFSPDDEIELISLHGECKEATVWFGSLAGSSGWRATVLPAGVTITGEPLDALPDIAGPHHYVHDPDPAVVRAGLVNLLADELGCDRLDDAEEYLTSEQPIDSPFVQSFELLAELPNNEKAIRRHFRESSFGQVEIKCRHIPVDADRLRKKLTLDGDEPGVLIIARVQGKSRALVCRRV